MVCQMRWIGQLVSREIVGLLYSQGASTWSPTSTGPQTWVVMHYDPYHPRPEELQSGGSKVKPIEAKCLPSFTLVQYIIYFAFGPRLES